MTWLPFVSLLNACALAMYAYLAFMVVRRNRRSPLNWTCAGLLVVLMLWSTEDIVHGNPAASLHAARIATNIGVFGWGSFASLNLLFVLTLTRQRAVLRTWVFYPFFLLLPALFVVQQFSGHIVVGYTHHSYGWGAIWSGSLWAYAFYVYYSSLALFSLYLLFRFSRRAERARERRQAAVIFRTGTIAFAAGTVTDVVLPMIPGVHIPELASVATLLWAWGLYRAVTYYGLMSVTVQAAADDILAAMGDSMLLLSPDGTVITCNQSFLDMVGRQRSEVTGAKTADFFAAPEELSRVLEIVAHAGTMSSVELDLAGGERNIPVSISGRMMREPDGDAVGIVLVLHDITARRAAQAEVVKHERLAALGQVAGSLAHELRNPLAAIRNAAYFLKLTVADKLEGKPARHLEIIESEIERSSHIISSLLDFARGRMCEPVRLDFAELAKRAAGHAKLPDDVRLDLRLPDDAFVRADPVQIEQVLVNLLTNAKQAMPDGGSITLSAVRCDGHFAFRLSDTGAGIKPENLPRLFEPLFSTKTFGVGLGLAVSRSFIEANGGKITVESEVGKGSTFSFSLPAAK